MPDPTAEEVILGLLEIAATVLPDSFWETDSRIESARVFLGDKFPTQNQIYQKALERPDDSW